MNFGELENDKEFISKATNLSKAIDDVKNAIETACNFTNYEELSKDDQIKFDLFLSYSINSLFWILCKLQCVDVTEHGIRNEMSRVRQAMIREKQVREHRTLRPVIDAQAASRFIRHGLWDPKKKQEEIKAKKRKLQS